MWLCWGRCKVVFRHFPPLAQPVAEDIFESRSVNTPFRRWHPRFARRSVNNMAKVYSARVLPQSPRYPTNTNLWPSAFPQPFTPRFGDLGSLLDLLLVETQDVQILRTHEVVPPNKGSGWVDTKTIMHQPVKSKHPRTHQDPYSPGKFSCIIIPNHLLYFIVYYAVYLPPSQYTQYTQQTTRTPWFPLTRFPP